MSKHLSEESAPEQTRRPRRRRVVGRILLILGPAVVAVTAAYFYWSGGRFVTTDNAYIQADKAAVSSEVSGNIVAVEIEENEFVNQGDPLFRIDERDYLIAVDQARARLQSVEVDIRTLKERYRQKLSELELAQTDINFADTEFKRQSMLAKNRVIPKADLDQSGHDLTVNKKRREIIHSQMEQILAGLEGDPEIAADRLSNFRLAKAELEEAELQLEKTTVRAPFAGRVSKIPTVGKHVEPGQAVMSLIADRKFWVEANIKETDLTHVQQGQAVRIEVDTYPDGEWQGIVQSISPASGSEYSIIPAQNATGNWVKVVQRIPVRISVESPQEGLILRAGMSSYVRIDTGFKRQLPALVRRGLSLFGVAGEVHAGQTN